MCQHLSVARVAETLAVSWNTANDAVLTDGRRVPIADPQRFDGVTAIGVDEHVGRHTRRGDKYVTAIIDLTPVRNRTGPARLLDMVPGRSKQAFKQRLANRPEAWRQGLEVVAMDGFTGFKTATSEQLPNATAVMNPFHVVALAGDASDPLPPTRPTSHPHRGRTGDPLYGIRRVLRTGSGRVLLRKSDTEPVLRVMVEAATRDDAQLVADEGSVQAPAAAVAAVVVQGLDEVVTFPVGDVTLVVGLVLSPGLDVGRVEDALQEDPSALLLGLADDLLG